MDTLVYLIIALVVGFAPTNPAAARERDQERRADIDALHSAIEAFYAENGGYPRGISPYTLPLLTSETFIDPSGKSIENVLVQTDEAAARAAHTPTNDQLQYVYIPYGRSNCTDDCAGYILKTYVETVQGETTYIKAGLNNQ